MPPLSNRSPLQLQEFLKKKNTPIVSNQCCAFAHGYGVIQWDIGNYSLKKSDSLP